MNKLFIGSLGAFGVVLETTYRLVALPQDDQVLAVLFPTLAQATAAALALRATPLLPSALFLLHADVVRAWNAALPLAVQPPQVVLLLNCDGICEAVARHSVTARPCAGHTGAWLTPPCQVRLCLPCGHSVRTGVVRWRRRRHAYGCVSRGAVTPGSHLDPSGSDTRCSASTC